MKPKYILFILISFINFSSWSQDNYYYPDLEDCYIGTYIPVVFDNYLKKSKLLYESMTFNYPEQHAVLFMGKNRCNSDKRFHDHYAIQSKDFKNYRFATNDNGTFCIDSNGNSYKKISGELNQYGDGYTAFTDYVLNEIFKFSKDMKNIELIENGIKIDGKTYTIVLDAMFFEPKNVALWLYDNNKKVYALVKNGYNGELHETSRGETSYVDDGYCPDNKILTVFPLMFIPDDNDFPGSSRLPKEQLRYLRNLIYARHGYIFKNNELKTYFKNFSWYKPNPNFSDDDFSNQEKYLLRILQSEEENK